MGYLKFALAAAFAAGILMYPADALDAALAAMDMWRRSVAPVLFPFAALMPYLTSPQARYVYDKILGWFMCRAFGLPGRCASAFVTGLISGSPGGAMAAARVAAAEGLSSGQAARLGAICCGMSPVYLVSGLGVAIMGAPDVGWRLAISQWLAHIMVGIGFSGCWKDENREIAAEMDEGNASPVAGAAMAVIRVCGYMALFSVGLAVVSRATGLDLRRAGIVLDMPGSAAEAIAAGMDTNALALAVGFGGICIAAQNMSVLKVVGVTWKRYLIQKISAAILCMGLYVVLDNGWKVGFALPEVCNFEVILLVLVGISMPVTAIFLLKKGRIQRSLNNDVLDE